MWIQSMDLHPLKKKKKRRKKKNPTHPTTAK